MRLAHSVLPTPIGDLLLVASERALTEVHLPGHLPEVDSSWQEGSELLSEIEDQLTSYFDGKRREFQIPLAPEGTEFQRRVWQALRRIPYGKTISYSELARRIGSPQASRAVGAANGRNPIPIVIPCHRVIGKDGSLTGFGGGLGTKRRLLDLEGVV